MTNLPRYFFHLTHSEDVRDEAGIELAGLHSAKCHAVKMIADDLCKTPEKFWVNEAYNVSVTNDRGLALFSVEMLSVAAPVLRTIKP